MPGPLRGPSAVESRLCTDHIRRDPAQDSAAEWDSLRVWGHENADPRDHAQPRRDEGGMLGEAHHQASHAAADAAATALSPLWVGGPCQPLSKKHNHVRGVYIPTRLVSLKKVLTGWRLVRKLQCAGGSPRAVDCTSGRRSPSRTGPGFTASVGAALTARGKHWRVRVCGREACRFDR